MEHAFAQPVTFKYCTKGAGTVMTERAAPCRLSPQKLIPTTHVIVERQKVGSDSIRM